MTDSNRLFGGILDLIETETNFSSIMDHIKVSALLFDSITVQDSWLFCNGPIVNHIKTICNDEEKWETDDFVKLLEHGIIQVALRTGSTLHDVWNNGQNCGITPGEFLTINKEDGDSFIPQLSKAIEKSEILVPFPKPIISDNKSIFGQAVENFLSKRVQTGTRAGDYIFDIEDREIQLFLDSFKNFVDKSMSQSFRRGQVEQFIADELELEKFSYSALYNIGKGSLKGQVALSLMEDISTLYAGTQSRLFHVRPQAFYHHDSRLLENYLVGVETTIREVMPNCVLDLSSAFSASKLHADDIVFIRNSLGDGAYFKKALSYMDACSKNPSETTFSQLVSFLKYEYIPEIIKFFPKIRIKKLAHNTTNPIDTISKIGNITHELADNVGILCTIAASTAAVASCFGNFDLLKFIGNMAEMAKHYAHLEEVAAAGFFVHITGKNIKKGTEKTSELLQTTANKFLTHRACQAVDSWANPRRNNYLTRPTEKH